MREELRCALDGNELTSLDPRIYIEDIEEQIRTDTRTAGRVRGGAVLCGPMGRESLAVMLRLMIKEKDRAERARVLARVNGWAKKGWLTVSTRPWQRLYVVCTQPADGAALRWSESARLVWTALDWPYWMGAVPDSAAVSGASDAAWLCPEGTRDYYAEAELKNESGDVIDEISFFFGGGEKLAFSGLGLADGGTFRLFYDERHLLRAEADGAPVLHCLTADSQDEICLPPGRNSVIYYADGLCSGRIYARGVFE